MNYKFDTSSNNFFTANSKKSTTVSPVIVNPSTTKEQLIFSEDFNNLDESLWSRDIKMPLEPVSINLDIKTSKLMHKN